MAFINYNGKILTDGEPVFCAASRGIRYGDGLFETIKCINGKLILGNEHFSRLWKGMGALQFNIPRLLTPELLETAALSLALKNGHEKAARVRLTITRSNGGLYDPVDLFPNYSIETQALINPSPGPLNSNGLVIGIYDAAKKSCDILSNLKHNNFLPYVMAALYAKKEHWNDAILLNTEGRICESTIANIFIISRDQVFTPSLTEGCVAGVMRKAVIRMLAQENISCTEKQISVEELLNAEEVFLSNSIQDIRWVQRIGNITYGHQLISRIHTALNQTIY